MFSLADIIAQIYHVSNFSIENFTDDYCELYAIPNPNKISTTNHKPEEIYFTNPDDRYKIFARLHLK